MNYKALIEEMTLEEKASLLSGANYWNTKAIKRLGIPSMMITDGPHGLRKQGGKADHLGLNKSLPSTCFPTASALANSWDIALVEKIGSLLATEAAAENVSALCGPGLNIKRNPLCGRNFEYFSEDPYLTGQMAAAMINGIQSKGVAACPKHFAVNSQESYRMNINEVVDERALREIYLEGFRYAVQQGKAKMIMTSYNRINGVFANENTHLMQDILYKEWGFKGVAVTDWGGENDRVRGLVAGNQLEMPTSNGLTDREIVSAVQNGTLSEGIVDNSVEGILALIYDTLPYMHKGKAFEYKEHHAIARNAAAQSVVLLKNHNNLLPLSNKSKIAIIGDFAKTPRYQGAGSSLINHVAIDNSLDNIKQEKLDIIGYAQGFKRFGGKSRALQRKGVALAAKADITLLFLGLDEGSEAECVDRTNMQLPQNQIDLLAAVTMACSNVIVILSGGSAVEMPWANKVGAIVHGYLGGQAGAGAIADILTGKVSPSGKLAETYPLQYKDTPSYKYYLDNNIVAKHAESIFVGYRYFDTARVAVQYPFGYGLSYTSFEYSQIKYSDNKVKFKIKNTGKVAGAEIAQVYISKRNSQIFRAVKELKGFARAFLQPNEEQEVVVALDEHAFAYFDTSLNEWAEEGGEYNILVGASSQDIKLEIVTAKAGTKPSTLYSVDRLPSYFKAEIHNISDAEYEVLLGRKLPAQTFDASKPLDYTAIIEHGKYKRGFARLLYNVIRLAQWFFKVTGNYLWKNNIMFLMNLPYRQLARMSNGLVNTAMLDGILVMANGQFCKGLTAVLKARKAKKEKRILNRE
ncbi:MAG: glycoside hydrolase family 3 C-terminal domain-containing protein [Oscillospiraceae bacterium]